MFTTITNEDAAIIAKAMIAANVGSREDAEAFIASQGAIGSAATNADLMAAACFAVACSHKVLTEGDAETQFVSFKTALQSKPDYRGKRLDLSVRSKFKSKISHWRTFARAGMLPNDLGLACLWAHWASPHLSGAPSEKMAAVLNAQLASYKEGKPDVLTTEQVNALFAKADKEHDIIDALAKIAKRIITLRDGDPEKGLPSFGEGPADNASKAVAAILEWKAAEEVKALEAERDAKAEALAKAQEERDAKAEAERMAWLEAREAMAKRGMKPAGSETVSDKASRSTRQNAGRRVLEALN